MQNVHSFIMQRVIARYVDRCLLLSPVRSWNAVSQRHDICLLILDMKNWLTTISVGWIIRIRFKVKTGIVSHSDWLLFEEYQGFFHLSKVNLHRYITTCLCSDLRFYRTDFWSLLCLYGTVLRWATLHHLIPMSYDMRSWGSFVISLFRLIWDAHLQTLHKKYNK
jgi:hypothetical protein